MEITFTWNTDDVLALTLALEAKGFKELADKVETSFNKNLAKAKKSDAIKQFRADGWADGKVFRHSDGLLNCIYWSYKHQCFSTVPMYINDILMGSPCTWQDMNRIYNDLVEAGFRRVEE